MKRTVVLLVGVLFLVSSSLVRAQSQGAQPFELSHVHSHCGTEAAFFYISVDVKMADGNKVTTNVINCLSSKDGLLVNIVCSPKNKTCTVDRNRDQESEAIEKGLRSLAPRPSQLKT